MKPGVDPPARLCDRGSDRPHRLRRDGLSDDARRAPASGCRQAARSRAGRGGRSRPAGAVDRGRPDGDHLRRRHQQRHGVRHQHAGRRAWRRRRAMRRVLQRDRGAARRRRRRRNASPRRWRPRSTRSPSSGIRHVPGFGHRFHPLDPRAPRLLALVDAAAAKGVVSGRFAAIGRAIEAALAAQKGRRIPMNIDGATGGDLRRARLSAAALPRPVRAVALGRRARACLGRDAVGRTQQRTDPAPSDLDLYGPAPATLSGEPG